VIRRQWFPLKTRIFGPAPHPEELVGPRLPYTIPALELRRLLKEARARREVNYELSYTHLPRWWRKMPAGRLDVNSSRAHHGDSTVAFSVDGRGVETCTSGPTGGWMLMGRSSTPCGPRELPNLPPPGLWPLKFLLFYPVPLLPAEAGPSAEMPCVDP